MSFLFHIKFFDSRALDDMPDKDSSEIMNIIINNKQKLTDIEDPLDILVESGFTDGNQTIGNIFDYFVKEIKEGKTSDNESKADLISLLQNVTRIAKRMPYEKFEPMNGFLKADELALLVTRLKDIKFLDKYVESLRLEAIRIFSVAIDRNLGLYVMCG